jgi:hypothetical protein
MAIPVFRAMARRRYRLGLTSEVRVIPPAQSCAVNNIGFGEKTNSGLAVQ